MTIAIIIVAAISLHIRRVSWHTPQEQALTAAIAFQGAAAILMLPWTCTHVGPLLHQWTGVANLEDLIAHICYVIAGALVVMNSLDIQYEAEDLQRRFRQCVELPCVAVITLMVFLHLNGRGARTQVDDYFTITSGPYMATYWLLVCGILIYALSYAILMYSAVRQEPGFKWLVTGYVIAASFGILAGLIKVVVAILPVEDSIAAPHVRILAGICAAGFAICSAVEWWRYTRAMSKRTGELSANYRFS